MSRDFVSPVALVSPLPAAARLPAPAPAAPGDAVGVEQHVPAALLVMLDHLVPAGQVELEGALAAHLTPPVDVTARRVAELIALTRALEGSLAVHIPNHPVAPVQVAQKDYDMLRPAEAPTSGTLVKRYGHWESACRAAWGLLPDGRKTQPGRAWSARLRGRSMPDGYTPKEVQRAIRACATALCRRPSSNAYKVWVERRRRRAHDTGDTTPWSGTLRLPRS